MSNDIALPQDVLARLAESAKEAAAKERPAISRISLRSGQMTYAGQPIANNKLEAVILAASFRNVFYAGRYDPNNIVNPNCFALSLTDEDMRPHDVVSKPENPTCKGCPRNEWGSDPNGGRGKACKQTRRLVLLPGSALEDENALKATQSAEMALMDLPVTSVRNYSSFVNALSASARVPPWAAIALISVVPDPKTQFKVLFQPIKIVPSIDLLEAIEERRQAAIDLSMEPYEETNNAEPSEATNRHETGSAQKGRKY